MKHLSRLLLMFLITILLTTMMMIPIPPVDFGVSHSQGKDDKQTTIQLFTDPETLDLLDRLSRPLLQSAKFSKDHVQFHVMVRSGLNAFALPNGHIVFHSGLISAVRNRDELAGVMAHEIAHLAAGHHIQLRAAAKGVSIRTLIATVLGITVGALSGNSDITQAAVTGSSALGRSSLLAIGRKKETQADRLALTYMAQAQFNPDGLPDFLEHIHREQRLSNRPPPYLLSHPLTSLRLVEARDQAKQIIQTGTISVKPSVQDNSHLARIQAKLRAGSSPDPNTMVRYFQSRSNQEADRYGLSVALRYAGDLSAAEQILDQLLKKNPDNPYTLRERGLVFLELGQPEKAEMDFRKALQKLSKPHDLPYQLAFVLNQQGRHEDAVRWLRRQMSQKPLSSKIFYLLGVIEGERKRFGASHLALARYFKKISDRSKSLWHYKEALRHLPETDIRRRQIQEERATLR